MSRAGETQTSSRFTVVSVALTAVVAFLVGAISAGGLHAPTITGGNPVATAVEPSPAGGPRPLTVTSTALPVDFADGCDMLLMATPARNDTVEARTTSRPK